MKSSVFAQRVSFLLSAVILLISISLASAAGKPLWITAYYPASNQTGGMTPDKIDYSAITHLIHFSIVPNAEGKIADPSTAGQPGITPAQSKDVVTRAHKAGIKVLVCVGGAGSGPAISPVLADPKRGMFVSSLIDFITRRHYDGIDIDMEPINPSDEGNFIKLIRQLRGAMKSVNPRWLLTIPASGEPGDQPKLCALLQSDFDQINIQTYDLSGAWQGWKTWYNGSLYGDGPTQLTSIRPFPSVDEKVHLYTAAGVSKSKLGIGIAFYGYVWSGANGPAQSIGGVTVITAAYNQIMDQYYQPRLYHWDTLAQAPYLSIGQPNSAAGKFISYDDNRLARAKVLYVRSHGLGGVIIWQIAGDYRPNEPPARRDILLKAVKDATLHKQAD